MKPRLIAKQMNIAEDQIADVKRLVKRLVHQRKLQYGPNHLVMPIAAEAEGVEKKTAKTEKLRSDRIVGVFQRTSKGFGFVRQKRAADSDAELPDIYIPAKRASDASTGDTVMIQIIKPRPGEPGPRGEIVQIMERETHQFVGTYFESHGSGYVQVDGTLFTQPILVGDPVQKTLRPTTKWSSTWSAFLRPIATAKA